MPSIISKYTDDFLKGSETLYNYTPFSNHPFMFYTQIVGIQQIGPSYYNELFKAKEYCIQYTLEGEGFAKINDTVFTLKKGDLLIIPNYHHHIFKAIENKDWKIAFIHIFDNPIIMSIFQRIFDKHEYIIHNVQESAILPYITKIMDLLKKNSLEIEYDISSTLYELMMCICKLSDAFESDYVDQELSSVVHYLQQNFDTQITLRSILEHTKYSKNHLERLFKNKMDCTIRDYINKLRLKRAQELILTTNLSFKEIACQIGLSDYRSLVYLFHNQIQMTPTEFKETYSK